jgi:putative tricarboxylic transport membrane protein
VVAVGPGPPPRPSLLSVIAHYSTLVTLFGAWVIWQATLLREGPGYAAVGPKTFPLIVGVGMVLTGLALMWVHIAGAPDGGPDETGDAERRTDWRTLLLVGAFLAGYVVLYLPLGFVVSSVLFVPACGRALGSRSPGRDVIVAVGLALVTYFVFTRLLGLELPGGPIDEPLRALANLGKPPVGSE